MDEQRRRFFYRALLISIAVHLALGSLVRFERTPEPDSDIAQPIAIETRKPLPITTPPPTPKPTPVPTPPPKTTRTQPPAPRPAHMVTAHITSHHGAASVDRIAATGDRRDGNSLAGNGTSDATPGPATSTATPVPPPTPTPAACLHPNVAAATLQTADVDTPPLAAQQGISGIVQVIVSLDERSHVVNARIAKSPSSILNAAAIQAARASTFRTEVRDCQPIAAEYIFAVEFSAQ